MTTQGIQRLQHFQTARPPWTPRVPCRSVRPAPACPAEFADVHHRPLVSLSASVFINAPAPTFTSSTTVCAPEASFLLILNWRSGAGSPRWRSRHAGRTACRRRGRGLSAGPPTPAPCSRACVSKWGFVQFGSPAWNAFEFVDGAARVGQPASAHLGNCEAQRGQHRR